jgi:hypothetical protein
LAHIQQPKSGTNLERKPSREQCNKLLPCDFGGAMIALTEPLICADCAYPMLHNDCSGISLPPAKTEEDRSMKQFMSLVFSCALMMMTGCAPEVGSDAWCEAMVEKDKGDWTANDAAEFAGSCVFKSYDGK